MDNVTIACILISDEMVLQIINDLNLIEDKIAEKATNRLLDWSNIDKIHTTITLPTEVVKKYKLQLLNNKPDYKNYFVDKSIPRIESL